MYIQIHTHYVYFNTHLYSQKLETNHKQCFNHIQLANGHRCQGAWPVPCTPWPATSVDWWLGEILVRKKVAWYISYHFMMFCLFGCLHKHSVGDIGYCILSGILFYRLPSILISCVLFSWSNRYLITVISGQLLLLTQQNQSVLEIDIICDYKRNKRNTS